MNRTMDSKSKLIEAVTHLIARASFVGKWLYRGRIPKKLAVISIGN